MKFYGKLKKSAGVFIRNSGLNGGFLPQNSAILKFFVSRSSRMGIIALKITMIFLFYGILDCFLPSEQLYLRAVVASVAAFGGEITKSYSNTFCFREQ